MSIYLIDDRREGDLCEKAQVEEKSRRGTFKQILAGFSANLAGAVTGTVIGWTSPTMPILEAEDSPIPITKDQNSWMASLMPLGAVFGPFAAGYLAEKFGRKRALLLSAVPAIISWIILAAAKSVGVVYGARFLAGFTVGWIFTVIPMYCGEIADKNVRGAVLSLTQPLIVVGLLFDYCIGPYVPFMWLSIGAISVPVLFAVMFSRMPESPHYYLHINRKDEAESSLRWLRCNPPGGVCSELLDIQASVEKAKSESGTLKDLFGTRGTTKAFIISAGLMAFQQFSGINVVLFNSQSIFEKAGGSLKPEESTIVLGVIMLLSSVVTPFVVDKLGRKPLLLMSASGMTVAQGILGLCFYLERTGFNSSSISFLPLTSVIGYIIIYTIGFGPLPWAIMGEMFPNNVKSLASTLIASFCWILAFVVTRFFNDIVATLGNDYTFWLFALCCVVANLFVYFLFPETKGKSLAEIQKLLDKS